MVIATPETKKDKSNMSKKSLNLSKIDFNALPTSSMIFLLIVLFLYLKFSYSVNKNTTFKGFLRENMRSLKCIFDTLWHKLEKVEI